MSLYAYLGANTANGFYSLYDELFRDPRIQTVWIIKGGPGNGKSTFMRALGAIAAERGAEQEEILCSSDPDSLDALILPDAGIAVVDGTAPHVVEPPLCGLGARYIDFSAYYRDGMERDRVEILQAQQANKQCYPSAYACLRAAYVLQEQISQIVRCSLPDDWTKRIAEQLAASFAGKTGNAAGTVRRFFMGITPKGVLFRQETPKALCTNVLYSIRDSYGMSHAILAELHQMALSNRHRCLIGLSPLCPDNLEQLLIPEYGIGFLRTSEGADSPDTVDLDEDIQRYLSKETRHRLQFLLTTAESLIKEAVGYLHEAKAHHDRLELLCRPYVDFDGISKLSAQYAELLTRRLEITG